MIYCDKISIQFNNKPIFSDLTFSIAENKHTCICGPSGKGKSSILKVLQGYVPLFAGTVTFNGIGLNPSTITAIRKQIAWVPQNINLPVNNGAELLHMLEQQQNEDKAIAYLSSLGLEKSFLAKPFDEISGGQKQRIIIAACLCLGRKVLVMDEPTASLDEGSINTLIETVQSLQETTVISASHNPSWIEKADEIIELK